MPGGLMQKSRLVKALAWSAAIVFAGLLAVAYLALHTVGNGSPAPVAQPAQNSQTPGSGAAANNGATASPDMPLVVPKHATPPPRSAPIEPLEHPNPPAPPLSESDLIEQSLAKLKQGNLAYNTPQKMKTGETARVI